MARPHLWNQLEAFTSLKPTSDVKSRPKAQSSCGDFRGGRGHGTGPSVILADGALPVLRILSVHILSSTSHAASMCAFSIGLLLHFERFLSGTLRYRVFVLPGSELADLRDGGSTGGCVGNGGWLDRPSLSYRRGVSRLFAEAWDQQVSWTIL